MTRQKQRPRTATPEAAEDERLQSHFTAQPTSLSSSPEAAAGDLPEGVTTLAAALAELVAILPGLRLALEHQARPHVERVALRLDELAAALGVSRRIIERERSAGRFPAPDLYIGRVPLWRVETARAYLERGGR
jgi:hypothetical protein